MPVLLFVLGGAVIAVLWWLCGQRVPAVRVTGIVLAAFVAAFCALVSFALIADNPGAAILARFPGVIALLAYAATAGGAATIAMRGLRSVARTGRS